MNYLKEVKDIVDAYTFNQTMNKYQTELETFPASTRFHHCEIGGYIRHVWEVIDFCRNLIKDLVDTQMKIGEFTEIDVDALIRIAFLHDLDKLERYELDPENPTKAQVKYAIDLGIRVDSEDSKSSLSTKIDNKKNGLDKPICYFRYKDQLVVDESAKVCQMCQKLGIELSNEDIHCLACHHGGWSEAGKRGTLSPMATILHCADLMSTKILGDKV